LVFGCRSRWAIFLAQEVVVADADDIDAAGFWGFNCVRSKLRRRTIYLYPFLRNVEPLLRATL
jgi:hypothetical protein